MSKIAEKIVARGLQETIKQIGAEHGAGDPPENLDFTPGAWRWVGEDMDSDEIGSGVRHNEHKLAVQHIPARAWANLFATLRTNAMDMETESARLIQAVYALADFHEGDYNGRRLLAPIMPYWYDEAIEVFVYGAKEYAMWNWLKGQMWSVPLASAIRHARDILIVGEEYDPTSRLRHIGHFTCNIIMLATLCDSYPDGNDFPPKKFFEAK